MGRSGLKTRPIIFHEHGIIYRRLASFILRPVSNIINQMQRASLHLVFCLVT